MQIKLNLPLIMRMRDFSLLCSQRVGRLGDADLVFQVVWGHAFDGFEDQEGHLEGDMSRFDPS